MLFSECRAFGIAAIARSRALDVDAVGLANAFDVENALLRGAVDMAVRAGAGRVRRVREAFRFFTEAVATGLTRLFCVRTSDANIRKTALAVRVVNAGVCAA